jgi:hypothetical protein
MSKLAVVDNVNGVFTVQSEWNNNPQGAIMAFHERSRVLWGASDVVKATVKILDENLNVFEEKSEIITHEAPQAQTNANT